MKNVIQRNLPLNKKYTFVSATYISILDGNGCTCENCGKLIANMITVKDEDNRQYVIGQDCARTLTSLNSDPNYIFYGNAGFDEGKRIRAKYLNHVKKGNITGAYYYECTNGDLCIVYKIKRGGTSLEKINYPGITKNYLKDLIQ